VKDSTIRRVCDAAALLTDTPTDAVLKAVSSVPFRAEPDVLCNQPLLVQLVALYRWLHFRADRAVSAGEMLTVGDVVRTM
jgi:hypothetical protein